MNTFAKKTLSILISLILTFGAFLSLPIPAQAEIFYRGDGDGDYTFYIGQYDTTDEYMPFSGFGDQRALVTQDMPNGTGIVSAEYTFLGICFKGTALPGSAGEYTVKVKDMEDNDEKSYTITIAPGPQSIVCPDQTVSLGASVTLSPYSTDGNGDIIDVGSTLEAAHQPKYTFGGGDNTIATIDAATGEVTTVGAGTTTFTIDSGATESYEAAAQKEVELTVVAKASPTLTLSTSLDSSQTFPCVVNLTATLSGAAGGVSGKTIKFYINGMYIGSSLLNNGAATFNWMCGAAGTYTLYAVFEEDELNNEAQITITDYNISQEPTPVASIDYTSEKLTGLTASEDYVIDNTAVSADDSGNIAIAESWMDGASHAVVKKGNSTNTLDGASQSLTIPARPDAPSGLTAIQPSVIGGTGGISGTMADMEYSADQTSWTDCADGSTTELAPGIYYVRIKAAESSFTGIAANVTVPPHYSPDDPPTEPLNPLSDALFTFGGNYTDIEGIRLNGQLLTQTGTGSHKDLSGYSGYAPVLGKAEPGSVKVTLYKEFLQTLPNGVYSLTVDFADGGSGDLDFEIKNYTVTYNSNGGSAVPSQAVRAGDKITQPVNPTRANYSFSGWYRDSSLTNAWDFTNDIVNANLTLYAKWNYTGGSSSSGGSSSDSSSSSGSYNITTDKQPNLPKTATLTYSGTVKNGRLTFTITKAMVQAALDKVGSNPDGIALIFKISNTTGYTCQTVIIEESALDLLKSSGVKYAQADSAIFRFRFDSKAIAQLDSQTTGAVSINANPAKLNEAAQKLIGNRPAFDITVQFKKSGTTYNVNDLDSGRMTRWIAYKPASGENTGTLAAVYVDKNGVPSWIDDSVYDNGWVSWTSGKLSVYGVGYIPPTPEFTDTENHWAKDYIDFAVSRDLISGTGATTFSPDAPMTRAVFLSALGRLSGADVSVYTTSSFTDVSNTDPAMPYIEWAVEKKIVSGVGDNKFAPDSTITREQMAVMMVNYAKAMNYTLPVAVEVYKFTDSDKIDSWAKDAVTAVQQAGIIVGKTGGVFDPQGKATRAEGSTILQRFVELVIDPASARGWVQNDSGGWMYYGLSTGKLLTGWQDISSNRYYFDKSGVMQTEKWIQIDGKWYYFRAEGSLAVDTKIDGYEVGADGARK